MYEQNYNMIGVPFRVVSLYEFVHKISKDYITFEEPKFTIISDQEKIEYEKKMSIQEHKKDVGFSDAYLESLAILRLLSDELLKYDAVLLHGAAICVDDKGYIFTAKSGTGKTTHISYLSTLLGDKMKVINGDKPFLRIIDDKVYVYGTPWNGKENYGCNASCELKSIIKLDRGETNKVLPMKVKDMYPIILGQVNRPLDSLLYLETLNIIDKIVPKLTYYQLYCTNSIDAAKVSFDNIISKIE